MRVTRGRERDLSSDAGIDVDDEAGARKLFAFLVQHQDPKINAADLVPTPQQPDTLISLSHKELRRERGACRPPWHLPHSHRRVNAATRRPRRTPSARRRSRCRRSRASTEMEGSDTGAALGGLGLGRRDDVAILGSAASLTQPGAPGGFFKSFC